MTYGWPNENDSESVCKVEQPSDEEDRSSPGPVRRSVALCNGTRARPSPEKRVAEPLMETEIRRRVVTSSGAGPDDVTPNVQVVVSPDHPRSPVARSFRPHRSPDHDAKRRRVESNGRQPWQERTDTPPHRSDHRDSGYHKSQYRSPRGSAHRWHGDRAPHRHGPEPRQPEYKKKCSMRSTPSHGSSSRPPPYVPDHILSPRPLPSCAPIMSMRMRSQRHRPSQRESSRSVSADTMRRPLKSKIIVDTRSSGGSSSTHSIEANPPLARPPQTPEEILKEKEEALLQKYLPMGPEALVLPEIGGSSSISVDINNIGSGGVGKAMVQFEDICIKILHFRLGWSEEACQKRLPKMRAVKKRLQCLPYFLQPAVNKDTLNRDGDDTLAHLIDLIDNRPTIKSEPQMEEPKKKTKPNSLFAPHSNDKVSQYSEKLVTQFLDESKVIEGHPQRYEPLNKRFDFITRSLLWCLRPNQFGTTLTPGTSASRTSSAAQAASMIGRQPWERSLELNADVMNVWMSLMQEWSDKLYNERLKRYEKALKSQDKSPFNGACHVAISSESEVVSTRRVRRQPAHEFLMGYSMSSSEDDQPQTKSISSTPIRPKRSLFLSTDFMTTFENSLTPQSHTIVTEKRHSVDATDIEPSKGLEEGEVSQEATPPNKICFNRAQQHRHNLMTALMEVQPMGNFHAACEKVFRFFQRRRWNLWEFDFICWPINYLTAHWVLLTVDLNRKELVWADSYRRWYVEIAQRREDANKQAPPSTPSTDSTQWNKALEEMFGTPSDTPRDRAVSPFHLPNARLNYSGWMHFACVEEYLRYDFHKRKAMGHDMSRHSDVEKLFESGEPWTRVVIEHLPQQAKMSLDCGVYTAHFARCVGQFECTDEIDFDTDQIDMFRAMMAVLIGRGEIPATSKDLVDYNLSIDGNL
eukprot:Blabericola_migrator_1__10325@NODE_580_length_7497_cov_126_900135_g430_i0_p1_GENE_NODE_580_length_7497_cov_126_900135_g430_i0NODE_580_length_7497_cov_126_900135_g430_i0_p1_ORF_typecomplete_len919_score152_60Peptidase_C48/PF02902_19/1_5e06Peptidase_C48/PF02902_19/3_9e05DUF1163/PF06651_11/0_057_NODE_580_length_7497_cov_126_900135_g430_i027905546